MSPKQLFACIKSKWQSEHQVPIGFWGMKGGPCQKYNYTILRYQRAINQIQGPRNINNNVLIEWALQGLHFSCILTFSCWKTPQWYQDLHIDITLPDK